MFHIAIRIGDMFIGADVPTPATVMVAFILGFALGVTWRR